MIPASFEPVDFNTMSPPPKSRFTLSDGSVIEVKFEIQAIARVGNDPTYGFPLYAAQVVAIPRIISFPPELRKRPVDPKIGVR